MRPSAARSIPDNQALLSHLNHAPPDCGGGKISRNTYSSSGSGGGLLRVFNLIPILTTAGCKMLAFLLGLKHRGFITDHAAIGTIFGYRRGRVTLAVHDSPHSSPAFVVQLPINMAAFHEEMASPEIMRIVLESETKMKTKKKKKAPAADEEEEEEEFVWAVYCNGRKMGYSTRRNTKQMTEDEEHVMGLLRGVSMGAGVLPSRRDRKGSTDADGEITYLRARFERDLGSKDYEALYMINPDAPRSQAYELIILFTTRGGQQQ